MNFQGANFQIRLQDLAGCNKSGAFHSSFHFRASPLGFTLSSLHKRNGFYNYDDLASGLKATLENVHLEPWKNLIQCCYMHHVSRNELNASIKTMQSNIGIAVNAINRLKMKLLTTSATLVTTSEVGDKGFLWTINQGDGLLIFIDHKLFCISILLVHLATCISILLLFCDVIIL